MHRCPFHGMVDVYSTYVPIKWRNRDTYFVGGHTEIPSRSYTNDLRLCSSCFLALYGCKISIMAYMQHIELSAPKDE